MPKKLTADLSLDLDNLWSYLKTHGDTRWSCYPTYLDRFIPIVLDTMRQHDLRMTVFVVGQDAALECNQDALRMIPKAGHEIANHSFKHEPWLQRYSREQIVEELRLTEEALAQIGAPRPVGFRGPGYSLSQDVLDVLCERGYEYDASTLPTFLGPLARMYYFLRSSFSKDQEEDRQNLFGSFADGFRRLHPYKWKTSHGEIIEMPVSTIPLIRTPFHFSYLFFLARYSVALATMYFRFAVLMCKLTRLSPSFLLHPLDFLGGDEYPELSFFPGMSLSGEFKRQFCHKILGMYKRSFNVLPMGERAAELKLKSHRLPVRTYSA